MESSLMDAMQSPGRVDARPEPDGMMRLPSESEEAAVRKGGGF